MPELLGARTTPQNGTQRDQSMEHPVKPHLFTLDINQHTPAEVPKPLTYECPTCKVTFQVAWGREKEECPSCDEVCGRVKE